MFRTLTLITTLFGSTVLAGEAFGMTDAVQATFKLFNEASTATGFVVRVTPTAENKKAAYALVSAAHTFERMKGETCLIVLRVPKNDEGFSRKDTPVVIRKDGKDLWKKHKDADLAILNYEPPTEFEKFALPLEAIASEDDFKARIPAGTYVRLLCYPEKFEANSAGFPIVRHGVLATYPFAPTKIYKTFMVDFTTFGGDSGGPVFAHLSGGDAAGPAAQSGPLKLLGVVVSRHWHEERIKISEQEDRIIKHTFGLGTAVNAQLLRDLIAKETTGTKE